MAAMALSWCDSSVVAERRWRPAPWILLIAAVFPGLPGCGAPREPTDEPSTVQAVGGTHETARAVPSRRPRIVALGDSLTAGYGLAPAENYPSVLQGLLDRAGYSYEIVNMGVSGDTSAGGLRRLDWALEGDVRVVIVALGGNDALRGLPPAELERNLQAIIDRSRERGAQVLLCGMEAPPNLGASYTREFRAVYRRLARPDDVTLLPFLLDGVAGISSLNQADGIHPNTEGARRMASLVWASLQPLLDRPGAS
jgi:acyl-CoA thioesterase-1